MTAKQWLLLVAAVMVIFASAVPLSWSLPELLKWEGITLGMFEPTPVPYVPTRWTRPSQPPRGWQPTVQTSRVVVQSAAAPFAVPARPSVRVEPSSMIAVPVAPVPAPKPVKLPTEEIPVPLNIDANVSSRYGSFRVKIVDHGPVTISVWVNGGGPIRLDKVKGFETDGTNLTRIHSFPGAEVFYVDRITAPSGQCVLKVVPRG